MTTDHIFHWLLLQHLPDLTPAALRKLARSGAAGADPAAWLHGSASQLRATGLSAAQCDSILAWQRQGNAAPARAAALRSRDWLLEHDVRLVSILDPDYPPLLLEIADPPPLLYVAGAVDCIGQPQLAVVGSREASPQGETDAAAFAADLAAAGFVITSGMARGIDAAAHRGALAAGGRTIAVLGCGIDIVYPPRHRRLATDIRASGALVSEFPLGTTPHAARFPRRNRIISGLSLGVLVVEAALHSGSLITARLALEQNREVFALPGSIHSRTSTGTNALIRGGATLVRDAGEIVEELRGWAGPAVAPAPPAPTLLEPVHAEVLAAVGLQPTPLEMVMAAVAQPLPNVLAVLGELELRGLVENLAGSYRRLSR